MRLIGTSCILEDLTKSAWQEAVFGSWNCLKNTAGPTTIMVLALQMASRWPTWSCDFLYWKSQKQRDQITVC